MRPKVAAIVLNWNGKEDTLECLRSLNNMDYGNVDVIVVDNGSTDGSQKAIKEEFSQVSLVELNRNLGVSAGYNAGIKLGLSHNCKFFLCLNNDLVVERDFLSQLVGTLSESKVGIAFPAVYSYEAKGRIDNLGGRVNIFTGMNSSIAEGLYSYDKRDVEPDYTDTPLIRKEVLDSIGMWDEDYFAYYEDIDFCLRAKEAGWTIKCNPRAKIYHKRGRTSIKVRGLISYSSIRNRMMLVRKFGNSWQYLVTLMHILLLTLPTIALRHLLRKDRKHVPRYLLKGFLDGLLHRYGKFPDFQG